MKKIDPFLLTVLHKRETGLPLNIWFEDCMINWNRHHNPYKILIPSKEGKYYLKKCLWLSIDRVNPQILTPKKIKIPEEYINKIKKYIIIHYEDFVKHIELKESDYMLHLCISSKKEDHLKYRKLKKEYDDLYLDRFEKEFLDACNITSQITGLKVNIWSIHNGNKEHLYYKPKIKIGQEKSYLIVVLEESPIIIYQTLDMTEVELETCKEGLRYVVDNIDIFIKHYQDQKNKFNDNDLINELKKLKRKPLKKFKMIH